MGVSLWLSLWTESYKYYFPVLKKKRYQRKRNEKVCIRRLQNSLFSSALPQYYERDGHERGYA